MIRNKKRAIAILLTTILLISTSLLIIGGVVGGKRASDREELLDALLSNDLIKAEELLKKGVSPNKKTTLVDIWSFSIDSSGDYPILELARNHKDVEAMRLIVEYGGNVNLRKYDTPLTATCSAYPMENIALELIKFLIDKGADVNLRRKFDGCTPIQVIFEGSNLKEIRQEVFFYLTKNEADIFVKRSKDDATLLHRASIMGFTDVVEFLLNSGIDKSLKDKAGRTALDYANEYEHSEIIALLSKTAPQ